MENITMVNSDEIGNINYSSEMLSAIYTLNPDAISLTRATDGKIIDCNQVYLDQIGYAREEVIGRTSLELKLFSLIERKAFVDNIRRNNNLYDYEVRVKRKNGTYVNILYSARFITIDGEKIILSICKDITDRKEKEMLNDALNKVNAYINSTLVYDEIMQLIVEEGAKALGVESSVINIRERDGWVVKFIYNFPNNIIGQLRLDQESPTSVYVANEKKAVAFNNASADSRVNKNGMRLHGVASVLVAPIILKDEVKGIIAFYHHQKSVVFSEAQIDFANKLSFSLSQAIENANLFNDIKKSEEDLKRHAAMLDVSNEAIFSWDYDGGIVSWNRGAERLYGYNSKEAIGSISHDLLKTKFPLKFNEFQEILVNDKMWTGELTHTTKDGNIIIVESRQQLIQDNLGRSIVIETNRDITQRIRAEEELQNIIKRFYNILSNMHSSVLLVTQEGQVEFANPAFTEYFMLKETPEELEGLSETEMLDKIKKLYKNPDKVISRIKEIVSNYEPVFGEEIAMQNGNKTCIRDFIPISDGTKPNGRMWIHVDVTERKKAEEHEKKLLENEQQLTEELQTSNEELQSITEELRLSNEELQQKEYQLLTVNNSLRESEERFRSLADNIPNLAWMADADGWIFWYNKQWYEYTGTTLEEMQGWGWRKVHHPEYVESVTAEWSSRIKQGIQYENVFPLEGKDGNYRWFLTRVTPIRDEQGNIQRWFGTNTDITELKNAEDKTQELLKQLQVSSEELNASNEELQATTEELKTTNEELQLQMDFEVEAKRELEEIASKLKISNKELEQFAYVASHDLQEPLRMVTSFTQLLERRYKDKLDVDADEYIGFIVEGSKRMKYLIDDLLEFSRLNTQNREFESVLLKITLEDVLRNLNATIKENNAKISHDPLPTIRGDRSQINQLLQNLIANAIKFHGDEPPKVHISAEESGNEWIISVNDKGIGIDPDHQEQIFRIFKRLHTREEYAGTGIGLAICKRIIDKHNGKIWVESELGKGSTFYFTIPK